MTGWEIPELMSCLQEALAGNSDQLEKYCKAYSLAAISPNKRHFAVIRDFTCHITDGKINMLNAEGIGENTHKGMTLVSAYLDGGASSRNIILPTQLEYTKVEFGTGTISIYFDNDKVTTNFSEINQLWSGKLSEDEILEIFRSFKNESFIAPKTERQTSKIIETEFYGTLTLNDKIDHYCGKFIYEGINLDISFVNIDKKTFDKNLISAKKVLTKIQDIQNQMTNEMLKLKNETWLDEDEQSLDEAKFSKSIKLYALNIYEEGDVEFYYKAGDLFWGHEVLTDVDSTGNYIDSKLIG